MNSNFFKSVFSLLFIVLFVCEYSDAQEIIAVDAGPDQYTCGNYPVVLVGVTSAVGADPQWYTESTNVTANLFAYILTMTPVLVTTTFTFSLIGEDVEDDVTIYVNEIPLNFIEEEYNICGGDELELGFDFGTDFTYQWEWLDVYGETITSNEILLNASPLSNTEYTYTVTNPCDYSETKNFTIKCEYVTAGEDIEACNGEQAELVAENFDPGENYMWSTGPEQNINGLAEVNTSAFYTLYYECNGAWNYEENQSSLYVNYHEQIELNLQTQVDLCMGSAQIGLEALEGDYTYTWYENSSLIDYNTSQIDVTNVGAYTLVVNDGICDVANETIIVQEAIETDVNTSITICPEESVEIGIENLGLGYSYNWTLADEQYTGEDAESSAIITQEIGDYILVVNNESCSNVGSVEINISYLEEPIELEYNSTSTFCPGESTQIGVNNLTGNYHYSWVVDGETYTGNDADMSWITVGIPGVYELTVSGNGSQSDCVLAEATIEVSYIENPVDLLVNNTPTFCPGESVDIGIETLGFGYDYLWTFNDFDYTGSDSQNSIINVDEVGDYSLVVSSSSCTNVGSIEINVSYLEEPIELEYNSTSTFCPGESTQIGANNLTGNYHYSWVVDGETYTGSDAAMSWITVGIPGVYELTVSGNGSQSDCVLAEATIEVSYIENPVDLLVNNTPTFCPGESVDVGIETLGFGYDYLWTFNDFDYTGSDSQNSMINVDEVGDYTLVISNESCSNVGSVVINVDYTESPIDLLVNNTPTFCPGESVEIGIEALVFGYEYLWIFNDLEYTGENSQNPEISVDEVGEYTLVVSNGGCSNVGSVVIDVDYTESPEELVVNTDVTFCPGESVEIGIENLGLGYEYLWTFNSLEYIGSDFQDPEINVDEVGDYTLVVSNGACTNVGSIELNVSYIEEPIELEYSSTSDFCPGESTQIGANDLTGNYHYSWVVDGETYTGSDADMPLITVDIPGVYELTVSGNGSQSDCVLAEATIEVSYTENPVDLLANNTPTFCPGESVDIGIETLGFGYDYLWTFNDFDYTGSDSQNSIINVDEVGDYSLVVSSSSCTNVGSVDINVDYTENPIDLLVNNMSTFCPGESVDIGMANLGFGYEYLWTFNGLEYIGSDFQDPEINVDEVGNYTLVVSNGTCINVGTEDISVDYTESPEELVLNTDVTFCPGQSIDIGIVDLGEEYNYSWTLEDEYIVSDSENGLITIDEIGIYTLVVSLGSCENVGVTTINVTYTEDPILINLGTDQIISAGDNVWLGTLEPLPGVLNYNWEVNELPVVGNSSYISDYPLDFTTYTLNVDGFSCENIGFDAVDVIVNIPSCASSAYYHDDEYIVLGNMEWDGEEHPAITSTIAEDGIYRIKNRLIIPNGCSLTINADLTVEFGQNARIDIHTGGTLIVNGAKLTKACNFPWRGIIVFGNDDLPQNETNQGKVDFNSGSRIEYALDGVTLIGKNAAHETQWGTAGGILEANNTTFYNCKRGVQFMSYHDYSGGSIDNIGYLKNCSFIFNDEMNEVYNGGALKGISVWEVDGVKIQGCTFRNEITSTSGSFTKRSGKGIHSINSKVNINGYPTSNYFPILESDYNRNEIEGFKYGVYINNSYDIVGTRLERTDFSDNITGSYFNNCNYARLTGNNYNIPGYDEDLGTIGLSIQTRGAYIENSHYFEAAENTYVGPGKGGFNTDAGIVIKNCGAINNEVYRNDFDRLAYGAVVYGENGNANWPFHNVKQSGLEFLCNDFGSIINDGIDNYTDIYLHDNAYIDMEQGNWAEPARNRFSEYPGVWDGSISVNHPTFEIYRYYHFPEYDTKPHHSDFDKTGPYLGFGYYTSRNELCPTIYKSWIKEFVGANKLLIDVGIDNLTLLDENYKNILNGGIKPQIMEVLLDDFASTSEVHTKLAAGSPYLTDDVLIAAITRQIPLNQWDLMEILVWNGRLSRAVLQVFNQTQALNPYLASLVLNHDGNSQRYLLEHEMRELGKEITKQESDYAYSALFDETLDNPYTHIAELYEGTEHQQELQILISTQIKQGNVTEAQNLIGEYEVLYSDYYGDFKQIALNLASTNSNWWQMSESQINSLQEIASATDIIGSGYAKAVLEYIGILETADCVTPIIQSAELRLIQSIEVPVITRSLLSLSPNPSNGAVHAVYELPKEYEQASIEVHNALGQLVGQFELNNQYIISFDCGTYVSGIYLVSLKVNYEVVESQRLSILTK